MDNCNYLKAIEQVWNDNQLEEILSNFYPFVGRKIAIVVKNCDELFADSCESDRTLEPDDDDKT